MARLYANENFPLPAVEVLRNLGHDVLTSEDTGHAGLAMTDQAVLALARDLGRTLVTLNRRHFVRLHSEQPDHAGIVVCTIDVDFTRLAQNIHAALAAQGRCDGVLIRVNRPAL